MENKENRSLIDKKASEDQLACLVSVRLVSVGLVIVGFVNVNFGQCKPGKFSFVALSLFSISLSYSWKLIIFLEHSSFGARKEK